MTAELRVRANSMSAGEPDLSQGMTLVGRLTPLEPAGKQRSIEIPAGDGVEPYMYRVEPGRYLVELTMPSGRVFDQATTCTELEPGSVEFDLYDSPHETHAWQYLSGNVESQAGYWDDRVQDTAAITSPWVEQTQKVTDRDTRFSHDDRGDAVEPPPRSSEPFRRTPTVGWLTDVGSDVLAYEALASTPLPDDPGLGALGSQIPIDHTVQDTYTQLYRFRDGPLPQGPPPTGNRAGAAVEGGGSLFYATIPDPWIDVRTGDQVLIELLVDGRPAPPGSPVSVAVRDPTTGSGLAYLAHGSLAEARRIIGRVDDLLFQKIANPVAAAAGGYVLVGTDRSREAPAWHSWIANLKNWFDWLPDGAILDATLKLRRALTSEDRDEARTAFDEAYERGLPFYSLGLHWLVDGLSQFDDDEAGRKAAIVRKVAWRVDMGQPFVVLRMSKK